MSQLGEKSSGLLHHRSSHLFCCSADYTDITAECSTSVALEQRCE